MDGPSDPVARARQRFELGDYHGAVLLLQESTRSGAAYPDAFNLLGLSLALVDRPLDALVALDQAVALNPGYVEAHLNRSVILNSIGREQDAEDAIARAEQLGAPDESGFPAVVANRLANAHAELGRLYRDAGSSEEALRQYRAALRLRPRFQDIRLACARVLIERAEHESAGAELDRLLAAQPEHLDGLLLRGLVAYLQDDLGRAEEVWDHAAAVHREEPRVEIYRTMLGRRRAGRS